MQTGEHRFDVQMLGNRVVAPSTGSVRVDESPIGLFGASTGAAAALIAAAARPRDVVAVVSRGGRPDLAGDGLPSVRAPTLLIVGSRDTTVLALNESARAQMGVESALEVVPGDPSLRGAGSSRCGFPTGARLVQAFPTSGSDSVQGGLIDVCDVVAEHAGGGDPGPRVRRVSYALVERRSVVVVHR